MCIFPSPPKPTPMPAPPPPPEPITRDDPEINAVAEAERRRRLVARGRQSTILTGSNIDDPNVGTKTLLGG